MTKMHQLAYDPEKVRERCRALARGITRKGGAPTVAFNAATGEVLRAFDRSDPAEADFIGSLGGRPLVRSAPRANLILLAYREEDDGTRRVTRTIVLRNTGAHSEDA